MEAESDEGAKGAEIDLEKDALKSNVADLEEDAVMSDAVDLEKYSVESDAVDLKKDTVESDAVNLEKDPVKSDAVDLEKDAVKSDAVDLEEDAVKSAAVNLEKDAVKSDAVDLEEDAVKSDAVESATTPETGDSLPAEQTTSEYVVTVSDETATAAEEESAELLTATEEKMDVDVPVVEDTDPQPIIDANQQKDLTNLTDDLVLQLEDDSVSPAEVTENPTESSEQQFAETAVVSVQEEASESTLKNEIEELMQLPQDLNTEITRTDIGLEPEDKLSAVEKGDELEQPITDILEEATKRIDSNKWKPKGGSFSLGVPGLTFSAQNLKVANDGTKMVQIHQSQITASQLEALQSNPNIKVVFRHIPSGKSFTKPPKNLFTAQPKKNGIKRKHDDQDADDSIYNFDDFDGDSSYDIQPKAKVPNMGSGNTKYARYNPNVGFKKRVGRPRLIPDSDMVDGGIYSKPVLPAQIQLTDALVKLNKPGAIYTVKVHVKQVTHDILINMELNPKYNIVLTAKHEVPPEHSLAELVKEWEEKENLGQVEEEKDEVPSKETASQEDEASSAQIIEQQQEEKRRQKEAQRIKKEKQITEQQRAREQQRMLELRKEKEEAELLSATLSETKSRSGRVRKPSRFSLDIARMTKRHSQHLDTSPEKELIKSPQPPPPIMKQSVTKTPPSVNTSDGTAKKRGRGRPRKIKKDVADTSITDTSLNTSSIDDDLKKVNLKPSSPSISAGPVAVVMLSPADKREADKRLQESSPTKKDNKETEKPETTQSIVEDVEKDVKSEVDVDSGTGKESEVVAVETDEATTSQSSKDSDEPMIIDDSTAVESNQETKDETKTQDKQTKVDDANSETTIKGENPSDILARKLSKESNTAESKDPEKAVTEDTSLKDFVEEEGDVDNKYRLRKLLQQCSIEEIRSVAIPRALDIISVGDFFIHKAGQMSKKDVSFPSLYSQLEDMYTCVEKESIRYSTLLRRANKVGGDRRMEKVILMPVYNKQAAESLHINSSSIDAHIGGIYQKPTTHMIAANSFHMNCKMDPPVHRLKLPEINDRNQTRKKRGGGVFTQPQRYVTKQTVMDASATSRSYTTTRPRGSWKRGYQVRKPNYLGDQVRGNNSTTLQEHARMQLASRYQSQLVAKESAVLTSTVIGPTTTSSVQAGQKTIVGQAKQATTAQSDATVHINTLSSDMTSQATSESPATEEATAVVSPEPGKQLVAIGDGQYVELPEGYTLLQTDEGYIIGQPGATFVQGDDGNVYMTSTEDGATEMTDQVLTTTATIGESQTGDQILDQLTQG